MSRRPRAALLGLLTLAALPATARAEENRINLHFEAGPLVRLWEPGNLSPNAQGSRVGAHIGIAFEYALHDRLGLELLYAPDIVFAEFGGQSMLFQRFGAGLRLRPWLTHGYFLPRRGDPDDPITAATLLSDVWIDLHGGVALASETSVVVDAGVGTRVAVTWPIQIGIFARYQQLFPLTGTLNGSWAQLAAGVEISAGFLKVRPDPDEDDDGVADARDRCPKTPPDTTVNDVGCPQAKGITPPPRCSDTDLDGVCDGGDSCPETPLGTQVDKYGCPPEPDGEAPPENP